MALPMPKNPDPETSNFDKLMADQAAKFFLEAFPPGALFINECACCSTLHNAVIEADLEKYKHTFEMRIQEAQKLLEKRQRGSGVRTRWDLENMLNLKSSLNGGGALGGPGFFVGKVPAVLTNEFIISVGRNIRQSHEAREARITILEKRLSTIRATMAREEHEQRKQQKQYDLHEQGKQQKPKNRPLLLAKKVETETPKDGELASMKSVERMELAKSEFLKFLLSLCRRDMKGGNKADIVEDVHGAGREVWRDYGWKAV